MNRKLALVFSLLGLLLALNVSAADTYEEDVQFVPIKPVPPPDKPGAPVEVVEFFWYGCPHCYAFEPHVVKWKASKAPQAKFKRIPAVFNPGSRMHSVMKLHARMYYALQQMGLIEQLHPQIFKALHEDKRKLFSEAEVEAFLAEKLVDLKKYRDAAASFEVATLVNQAMALGRRYDIDGVPTLVVDGRYKSGKGFTSYEHFIGVASFLVAKITSDRAAAK